MQLRGALLGPNVGLLRSPLRWPKSATREDRMPVHRCTLGSLALLAALAATPAAAQDYPARPVRIISDSAPGSAIDVIIRIVAERLTQAWGQQVVAVNQPGAGGSIAVRAAAQSPADGYTLFVAALSTFVA